MSIAAAELPAMATEIGRGQDVTRGAAGDDSAAAMNRVAFFVVPERGGVHRAGPHDRRRWSSRAVDSTPGDARYVWVVLAAARRSGCWRRPWRGSSGARSSRWATPGRRSAARPCACVLRFIGRIPRGPLRPRLCSASISAGAWPASRSPRAWRGGWSSRCSGARSTPGSAPWRCRAAGWSGSGSARPPARQPGGASSARSANAPMPVQAIAQSGGFRRGLSFHLSPPVSGEQ